MLREYGIFATLSAPARRAWAEEVLGRGGLIVANGHSLASEVQALPIMRFMETQGYDVMGPEIPNATMCARGMLGSPVGLGHMFGPLAEGYQGRRGRSSCARLLRSSGTGCSTTMAPLSRPKRADTVR